MELRHLRYFDAVATERNFTKAAERIGVAQPPLSRQIRELELEFGVTLIDRTSRPVELTDAGRIFHDQCVRILASVEQLGASIRRFRSGPGQVFMIGVVGSIMQGAMPAMIRRFRDQMPGVEVELVELTTVEQVGALKNGRIDAGLGRVRINDPGVRREVLYEEPLVAAVPAGHRLTVGGAAIKLQSLQKETLILYPSQPRPSYADQVLALFLDLGALPERVREVREIQTALGLVASQAGVAIVPLSMQNIQRADIVYVPIKDSNARSPIILSQRLSDESHAASLFRDIGRAEFMAAGE